MENELRNHKKSDATKWWLTLIAFLLMGITLLGLLTGVIVPLQHKASDDTSSAVEETQSSKTYDGVETRFMNTQHVRLMSETPVTYAANGAYMEQTLTATVSPANATNQKVDWTVAWADEQTGTVTDYVTVTPTSDGSTTASVKCYQAFTGNIIITVTTRESGFEASCIVTFKGIPSEISVSGDVGASDDGVYYLGVGGTYTYDVALSNIFGSVGDEYYDNLTVTTSAYGSIKVADMTYNVAMETWSASNGRTITLEGIKSKFITASCTDGVLSIKTLKSIESYYSKKTFSGNNETYMSMFNGYASDDHYFTVQVTVPGTSLSATLKIDYDENVVTGVDVSSSEITF